ncbi:MAG: ACP S-malonyltransferase [Bacteriovoracaceae bacterium]|jgi:[acyl-carrier-protein] S-malonyltransferase|nr:ACP S-malonyltransferase [Bacteriovoracaceae bacterium]
MTKPLALLFPGQGSQYVGMGSEFASNPLFDTVNSVLDVDLKKMMLDGPEDQLKLTMYTQPAILTHSYFLFQKIESLLKSKNISAQYVLGHSVGEYAALVAAGSIPFESAVKAVFLRGKYMQEAVAVGEGKMAAILRLEDDIVSLACKNATTEQEKVMPANFNSPGQVVISGHSAAVDRAIAWLTQNSEARFKSVELPVSAPFHSALMKPAENKLSAHFDEIPFASNTTTYIANIDGKEYVAGSDPGLIRSNLVSQVCGSVLWRSSIENLPDNTICLEVGPGKILTGLVRKINRNLTVIPMDSEDGTHKLEQALNGDNS